MDYARKNFKLIWLRKMMLDFKGEYWLEKEEGEMAVIYARDCETVSHVGMSYR